MLEDSLFDILLVSTDSNGSLKIHAVYNNLDNTPFFLKAHMISDSKTGVAITDASFRCVVSDLVDGKYIAVAGQSG